MKTTINPNDHAEQLIDGVRQLLKLDATAEEIKNGLLDNLTLIENLEGYAVEFQHQMAMNSKIAYLVEDEYWIAIDPFINQTIVIHPTAEGANNEYLMEWMLFD